jgi:hypothetical protein
VGFVHLVVAFETIRLRLVCCWITKEGKSEVVRHEAAVSERREKS